MTDAFKGAVLGVTNSALVLVVSFGVDISDGQQASITGFVNAVLVAWILGTRRRA